jgi:ABC-type lipopolysaccharide export system ATPase subunit
MMPTNDARGEVVLSIGRVAVHFGGLVALSDLNFNVCEGEIVGLIGPNGAGKTTAFNVFTGFLKPTAGEVRYRNTLLNGLKPHEITSLGLVRTFQRTSIFQNNTVFENVLIGLHRLGQSNLWDTLLALPREKIAERELADKAREILRIVGLERRAADVAATLPYGEQRLARYAHGHAGVGPHRCPQLWPHHRRRSAGGHPEESGGYSRISWRREKACLSCAMWSAATARYRHSRECRSLSVKASSSRSSARTALARRRL